jgi:outer membrane autotransporter protein/uncharacterized repeat protein (TIGR01451 family)
VTSGNALTYTITVANGGPNAAAAATLTDPLPAGVTFASLASAAGWTCATPAVGGTGTVSCSNPSVLSGASDVFTLVVTVGAGTTGAISNTATVATTTADPNAANDSATTSTTAVAVAPLSADVSVTKLGTPDPVTTGGVLSYTVTVANNGPDAAASLLLLDTLPAGVTFASLASPAGWSCTTPAVGASGIVSCSKLSLAASASDVFTLTVNVTAPASSVINNTTTVTSTTADPIPGNNSATATTNVGAVPVTRTLTIVSDGTPTGTPGSTVVLTVNAKDNGVGAPGVTINWTVSAGLAAHHQGAAAAGNSGNATASSVTLSSTSSTTDASGNASVTITLGATAGTDIVTGTRADDPSVSVSFSVTTALLSNLPGITPDERAIAVALDEACTALAALPSRTQQQQDLYLRCLDLVNAVTLDPTDVLNALDEMFPDLALVQGDATLSAAQAQFQNLKARIAALRSGTQGSSFGGLAFTNSTGTISLDSLMSAFGDDKPEVGKDFSRWGFFASGTIGRAEAKAGQFIPAYDYDINGITAGVDYRKSDKLIFGGAVGFTHQDTDLKNDEGSVKTTGWSVSAYGTYFRENSWYTDAVLTFGHNNYDTKRMINYSLPLPGGGTTTINQVAKSSSGGSMFEGAFTFGHDFQKGAFGIGPYGRLLYTRVNFGQINETLNAGAGSGLGVSIDSRTLTSFASQIGAKFTYSHSTSWGVLMPHAQVEWEHEFKDDPQAITARFLADPTSTPISFHGDARDTDFFRLGVGMSMVMAHGRSGFFYVEDLLGRNGYSQYNLAVGLRIEF